MLLIFLLTIAEYSLCLWSINSNRMYTIFWLPKTLKLCEVEKCHVHSQQELNTEFSFTWNTARGVSVCLYAYPLCSQYNECMCTILFSMSNTNCNWTYYCLSLITITLKCEQIPFFVCLAKLLIAGRMKKKKKHISTKMYLKIDEMAKLVSRKNEINREFVFVVRAWCFASKFRDRHDKKTKYYVMTVDGVWIQINPMCAHRATCRRT